MFNNILVICIGNICRSPSAEYMLRQKLAEVKPNITIHSAGLGALVDKGIDDTAAALLSEHGIDPSGHRARQVDRDMLTQADLTNDERELAFQAVLTQAELIDDERELSFRQCSRMTSGN